jgi:hypothetical protein
MMSLWSIARSPLMHGGDLTKTDALTLSLLTNDEVLAVNQHSRNNRQLFSRDELIAWIADVPDSPDKYLAVFNARDAVRYTPEHAIYQSDVITRAAGSHAEIAIDLHDAAKIILVADNAGDGSNGDHALWVAPRFVLADGREVPATATPWLNADALWDSAQTTSSEKPRAMKYLGTAVASGISAQATAVITYAVPAGAARFLATGVVNEATNASDGGSVRFRVALATPATESREPGVAVAVSLNELGFTGAVTVRDLWTHQDLGASRGEFAPVIPWHGSGLYRLSPAAK